MKKSINLLLCISLLSYFSINLHSQTSTEELDQVKLVKQIIGTWEVCIGEDSIVQMTCTPIGEGILCQFEWKSSGKVYDEGVTLVGFSADRKTIVFTLVRGDGTTTHDIGRFVTEKKMVVERFLLDSPTHAIGLIEYDISPNSYTFVWYGRGQNITWEPLWENKGKYTKIK